MEQDEVYLLGGGVYAVTAAARLSREGHKVNLIAVSRRLGVFPFTVLPQQFFAEFHLNSAKHIEASITTSEIEDEKFELSENLYVCRTTPLLEELVKLHNIGYTSKPPHSAKTINCIGTTWKEIRCMQTLETADTAKNILKIKPEPGKQISITYYFNGLAIKTTYTKAKTLTEKNVLASVERATAFTHPETMETTPTISFLGPDYGEWRPNIDEALAEAMELERLLYTGLEPARLNVFIERIIINHAKRGEQHG